MPAWAKSTSCNLVRACLKKKKIFFKKAMDTTQVGRALAYRVHGTRLNPQHKINKFCVWGLCVHLKLKHNMG